MAIPDIARASLRGRLLTLKALIIRADGVLTDIDEMRRAALNQMIADAGFAWQCDRATFKSSLVSGPELQRMVNFFMPRLGYQRSSPDVDHLAAAMIRRRASIFSEMLQAALPRSRPGMRDLVMAAKAEGLRLALVSALPFEDALRLVSAALGTDGADRFDVIATPQNLSTEGTPGDAAPEAVFARASLALGVPAGECLVLECDAQGLAAATAAGFRCMVIRSSYAGDDPLAAAVFVADDVTALIGVTGNSRLDPFTAGQRADLIATLQRFHAGHGDAGDGRERTSGMKVATLLQAKGPAVKTISVGASIRELSQRLKTDAVGAMVVLSDGGRLAGIISERDVARGLAEHGAALPGLAVSALMTKGVVTCTPADSIASISKIMTQRRIRHLPVLDGDDLVGVVSIGDVLKYRLDEVQLEATVLRDLALAKR